MILAPKPRAPPATILPGAEGKIVSPFQSVLVYDEHNGFYGGVAFKNGALAPNDNDNQVYYGQYVSMSDILFDKKLEATPAAVNLAEKIKTWSKKWFPSRGGLWRAFPGAPASCRQVLLIRVWQTGRQDAGAPERLSKKPGVNCGWR